MKMTSCSLMALALAAVSTCPVSSAEAPQVSVVSEIPTAAVETPASRQAAYSSAVRELGLDAARPADDAVFATAEKVPPASGVSGHDKPASYHSWIEQVRAQRRARVEDHREAMEARRSHHAPWDHLQYGSLEAQREKMREARQMHNQRREQAQRDYRRWTNPHGEFMKEMHDARRQLMEAEADQQRLQADLLWQRQQEWMYRQMPHGWNNPWYYRGY